jgi:putative ABC transport system permease protein
MGEAMDVTRSSDELRIGEASRAPDRSGADPAINHSPIHSSPINHSPHVRRRLLRPRWAKVARDLASHKSRSLLVVLSIAVGVFAIGVIAGTQHILNTQFTGAYVASNPAHAALSVGAFDDGLLDTVSRMDGVAAASASFGVPVTVQNPSSGRWQDLAVLARPDWYHLPVNSIRPEEGAWPPPLNSIVLERNSLPLLGVQIGDTVQVDLGDGRLRELVIAGTVHDINLPPARFVDQLFGYASFDTLSRWGYDRRFNELMLTVAEQAGDKAHIEAVVQQVEDKIEKGGGQVFSTSVPDPGQAPVQDILDALFVILGVLGVLSLLLSGFLVVNTVNATLAQQTRQVGVMKAIGARNSQIMSLYFGMALVYGLLALLIGLPLGMLGAVSLASFASTFLNFDVAGPGFAPQVLALQVAVALAMPLLASAYPIYTGARITVREAMASYGLGKGRFGRGPIDHLLLVVQRFLPFVRRPLVISLRNTFRRKGRLALTMVTLTLGGAIFVGVFSVRSSLFNTLALANRYDNYDVAVEFSRPYRDQQIQTEALQSSGVTAVETWGSDGVVRVRPDGSESARIRVRAPYADTQMIQPNLLAGRWLLPDDQSAVVLNSNVLADEPDLGVGDKIRLRLNGKEADWTVVGIAQSILSPPTFYVNYPYFAQQTGTSGRASFARVATEQHSPAAQQAAAEALESRLDEAGFQVSRVETKFQRQESIRLQFNILISFLLVMALLIATVGGMGLMGTMSINVLERTKEIGVMRAIGAATGSILQIVLVEGVLIGLVSWAQGVLFAWPIGRLMSDQIGLAFLDSPLEFRYSVDGALIWLAAALLISAVASFWPAHNAASLSVRDVLAYE